MGVFSRDRSGSAAGGSRPYICLSCETRFSVQYHACPECGSYDVRHVKWVEA
ncbi:hypothetical protein HTIA_2138 [Halorhabdus tiamatea SARL4B]|uniref:Hydrogenase maturation nickel metallochaperone HypA n=1 Tax=Halorhabdus tiamatea SARL4B TaxID=1033806 RepID=S6D8Y1_9EURY|nr:hypothetical protein HTIA_2138 [Halorhabdus tiamatea SARL4B]